MKALVGHRPGDFRLEEIPDPVVPAGGILVDVEAAGVCAADRMLWTGEHPWGLLNWPFIPGHELLGRVTASDNPAIAVGMRMTAEVKLPCGSCPDCAAGRTNLCPTGLHLGSGIPGAFAQQLALPSNAIVHAIPDELPLQAAVLAEPMACALHAVRRGNVGPDSTVAVIGLGGVGALALHAARQEGATEVCAITRSQSKAKLAEQLGANALIDLPDVVIEASGNPDAAKTALDLVRPGGTVVLYGVYQRPASVDLNAIAEFKELTVVGGHLAPHQFPDAIAMLATVPDGIVTGLHRLENFRSALDPPTSPRLKEVVVP